MYRSNIVVLLSAGVLFAFVLAVSGTNAVGQKITQIVPSAGTNLQLQPVLSGLSSPDYVTNAKDGTHRLFVVEQGGIIKVLQPGAASPTEFLNITDKVFWNGELGLLGLAFHPNYKNNRRFFVNYTRRNDGATVIAEYAASAGDLNVADANESVLLVIPQPFFNHNGGMIEFGPDGFLYIGMGDGGAANDPGNRAQNTQELLGKMLRINVDVPNGLVLYSSPPDNPFYGTTSGRDEIYAVGFRNPFRWSFDRETGQLVAGDVGQDAREEIDIVTLGGNYGWRVFEGTLCTNLDPPPLCSGGNFIPPIAEYDHSAGRCSVIGGYVYRGIISTLPSGSYVFGDFCTGEIFLLDHGVQTLLLDTSLNISSFGEDEAGEIYVVGLGGTVHRLINADNPMGSITANPNPIPVCDGSGLGATTLSWTSSKTTMVEVRIGSPSGPLFAQTGPAGSASTGKSISQDTTFFLQDVSGGLPLSSAHTLATVTVSVINAGCSQFISQSVPASMTAGLSYSVSITMKNVGANTWTAGGGYRLGSGNPLNNLAWGVRRVELPSSVSPGSQVTFTFNVTAPPAPGTYNFQWSMLQELVAWFGELTPNVTVNVGPAPNAAQFIAQSVPASMTAGQSYIVSITMKNTSPTTWSAAGLYRLGSWNPPNNSTWGVGRVELPSSVGPGSQVTFTFNVTAPSTPGIYNFQWGVLQESVEWFGDLAPNVAVNVSVAPNASQFVSQSVPASMTAGQTYTVSVTMKNVGANTWTAAGSYRLGSWNPPNNSIWGVGRVALPSSVSPGSQVTFTFNVIAPSSPGIYNFQWSVLQEFVEWFGDLTPNVTVNISARSNAAQFVSQSVPASMTAGQSYTVSVTMKNVGTNTWTAAGSHRLGSWNPPNNSTWGGRVELPSSVGPGSQVTFTFNVTAPSTPGTYNFRWGMLQEFVEWFGDLTPNVAVNVSARPNDSQFVSQSVPASMTAGQSYSVSVTMKNVGANTWTAAGSYRLGSWNPPNNSIWGVGRVALPSSVGPGSQVTFTFNVTAPSTPGVYNFQWGVLQEFVEWFGDFTPNLAVNVSM